MAHKTLTDEYRNIATKAKYDKGWTNLKDEIESFMNEERRTWNGAIFMLIKWGLDYWKKQKGKKK